MASIQFPQVPPSLKPVQTVMKIALDVEKSDPIVAYWCRFYVVQNGLKIDSKSKEAVGFLTYVMDWLEKEKKLRHDNESITNEMAAQAHVENYALKLFNKADSDDRAGNINKNTFKLFFIAATLFEVLKVFGEIPEDIVKREKYAKWKSTYINKCLRNGETPIPGPVAGTDAEEFSFFSEGAGTMQGNEQEDFNTFTPTNNIGFNNAIAPSDEPMNYTPNFIPASQLLNQQQQQQQQQQQPYVAPQNSYTPSAPSSTVTSSGASLPPDQLGKAQKYCKFAGSALQYEDVPTAIMNLQKALSLLTTGKED